MSDVLVVNASPLIFLGNAGRLDLLRGLGASRIVVPEAVFAEVTGTKYADVAVRSLSSARWIEPTPVPSIPTPIIEWDLGPGESAVIALAMATTGAKAVLDDLSGRKCALALGVAVMGTLGIVIAAHRRGHVSDPRQTLLDLRTAGMWLSDSIIEKALQLSGIVT